MEQKLVDFSIIKQKIIKTDEVIKMYWEHDHKLKKTQLFCKNLKAKHDQTVLNLKRMELENERLTFSSGGIKLQYEELDKEHTELKRQKKALEEQYNKQLLDSMSTIRDLKDELRMIQELNSSLNKQPDNRDQLKIKELEETCKGLKDSKSKCHKENERLLVQNKQLSDKVDKIKSEHCSSTEKFQLDICSYMKEIDGLKLQINSLNSALELQKHSYNIKKEKEIIKLKTEISSLTKSKAKLLLVKLENEKLTNQLTELYKVNEILKTKPQTQSIHIQTDLNMQKDIHSKPNDILDATPRADPVMAEFLENIFQEMKMCPSMLSPMYAPSCEDLNLDDMLAASETAIPPRIPDIIITPSTPLAEETGTIPKWEYTVESRITSKLEDQNEENDTVHGIQRRKEITSEKVSQEGLGMVAEWNNTLLKEEDIVITKQEENITISQKKSDIPKREENGSEKEHIVVSEKQFSAISKQEEQNITVFQNNFAVIDEISTGEEITFSEGGLDAIPECKDTKQAENIAISPKESNIVPKLADNLSEKEHIVISEKKFGEVAELGQPNITTSQELEGRVPEKEEQSMDSKEEFDVNPDWEDTVLKIEDIVIAKQEGNITISQQGSDIIRKPGDVSEREDIAMSEKKILMIPEREVAVIKKEDIVVIAKREGNITISQRESDTISKLGDISETEDIAMSEKKVVMIPEREVAVINKEDIVIAKREGYITISQQESEDISEREDITVSEKKIVMIPEREVAVIKKEDIVVIAKPEENITISQRKSDTILKLGDVSETEDIAMSEKKVVMIPEREVAVINKENIVIAKREGYITISQQESEDVSEREDITVSEKKIVMTPERKVAIIKKEKQEGNITISQQGSDTITKLEDVSERKDIAASETKIVMIPEREVAVIKKEDIVVIAKREGNITISQRESDTISKLGDVSETEDIAMSEKKVVMIPEREMAVINKENIVIAKRKGYITISQQELEDITVSEKKIVMIPERVAAIIKKEKQEGNITISQQRLDTITKLGDVSERKDIAASETKIVMIPEQEAVVIKKEDIVIAKREGNITISQQGSDIIMKLGDVSDIAVCEKKIVMIPEREGVVIKKEDIVIAKREGNSTISQKDSGIIPKREDTVSEKKLTTVSESEISTIPKWGGVLIEKEDTVFTEKEYGVILRREDTTSEKVFEKQLGMISKRESNPSEQEEKAYRIPKREDKDTVLSQKEIISTTAERVPRVKTIRRPKYRAPQKWNDLIRIKQQKAFKRKKQQYLNMKNNKSGLSCKEDCILQALLTLQKSKINFTISNESTLPSQWSGCDWLNNYVAVNQNSAPLQQPKLPKAKKPLVDVKSKQVTENLTCYSKACKNGYMLLNDTDLLGFFNVKNEMFSPVCSRLDDAAESKSSHTPKWLNYSEIPENVVDRLAELVRQKIQDSNVNARKPKRKRNKPVHPSDFHSETETELERLFRKPDYDILKRNKMLLNKAKYLNRDSMSRSSVENSTENSPSDSSYYVRENLQNKKIPRFSSSPALLSPLEKVNKIQHCSSPVRHYKKELGESRENKVKIFSDDSDSCLSFKLLPCPALLSPLGASTSTETERKSKKNLFKSPKIENSDLPKGLDSSATSDISFAINKFLLDESEMKKEINTLLNNFECDNSYNSGELVKTEDDFKIEIDECLVKAEEQSSAPIETDTDASEQNITYDSVDSGFESNQVSSQLIKQEESAAKNDEGLIESDAAFLSISDLKRISTSLKGSLPSYFVPGNPGTSLPITAADILNLVPNEIIDKSNNGCDIKAEDTEDEGIERSYAFPLKEEPLQDIPSCPQSPETCQIDMLGDFIPRIIPLETSGMNYPELVQGLASLPTELRRSKRKKSISRRLIASEEVVNDGSTNPTAKMLVPATDILEPIKRKRGRPRNQATEEVQLKRARIDTAIEPAATCDNLGLSSNFVHTDEAREKTATRKVRPKNMSNVLRQMRTQRKMFQTQVKSSCDENLCTGVKAPDIKLCDIPLDPKQCEKDFSKDTVRPQVQSSRKIRIVQNILIPPNSTQPVDLLRCTSIPVTYDLNTEAAASDSLIEANRPPVRKYQKSDVLSAIMGEMDKDRPQAVVKPIKVVKKDIPSSIEDKQWRKRILDVAEVTHGGAVVHVEAEQNSLEKVLMRSWKQALPQKIRVLLRKLFQYSNEEEIRDDIILEFKRLTVDMIVEIILRKLSDDHKDPPDGKHYPAPLMTRTQRLFLCLMLRLEKDHVENLTSTFLTHAEYLLFRKGCALRAVAPIVRLYVAVCKLQANISRMRTFCCKAFFHMGDFAVPLLFVVLTSWVEVMPMEADWKSYPMSKVLVQIVHLKVCNKPGYNLFPLNSLLSQYYGYPRERWNCDEFFEELTQQFLRDPTPSTEYAIRMFCRNKDTQWVYKKMNEFFKPLIYKIPSENVNFKASVIIMMGKLCRQFRPKEVHDEICLVELRRWFLGLIEDDLPELVKQSVYFSMDRLPKKVVRVRPKRERERMRYQHNKKPV